jgi:hypothetical protein
MYNPTTNNMEQRVLKSVVHYMNNKGTRETCSKERTAYQSQEASFILNATQLTF